jgi:hypothetical protein
MYRPWCVATAGASGVNQSWGRGLRLPLPSLSVYQKEEIMSKIEEVSILLVEDDPGHARLIEKNLRRANVKKGEN